MGDGRDGAKPLKDIWKRRSTLCGRDKELLRKRLDVVLCFYDIRRERGAVAWEKEMRVDSKGRKRRLGEIVTMSRKKFYNDSNKKRKKSLIKNIAGK